MRQKIGVILTAFFLLFSLVSCRRVSIDPFSYLETDFCAGLRGANGKNSFSCELTVRKEGAGRRIVLKYSAPAALSGISLSVLQGKDGAFGEATVKRETLSVSLPASGVKGLLAPALTILEAREPLGLQKREDALLVRFEGGELLLLENGIPQEISVRELAMVVDRWERLENE